MIAEFIHTYPAYTLEAVLSMYAITFYSLYNAAQQLSAEQDLRIVNRTAIAMIGGDSINEYSKDAQKRAEGIRGILKEIRTVKGFKK